MPFAKKNLQKCFTLFSVPDHPEELEKERREWEREMERREGRGERVRKLRRERELEGGKVAVYARCIQ